MSIGTILLREGMLSLVKLLDMKPAPLSTARMIRALSQRSSV